MKLRIRCLETRQTLKIETQGTPSLQNLKDTIAEKISSSSVSSQALHLSLNRQDEIIASPNDSLTALGISSGDLIYYTLNIKGFSSESSNQVSTQSLMEIDSVCNSSGKKSESFNDLKDTQVKNSGIQEMGNEESVEKNGSSNQSVTLGEGNEGMEEDLDVVAKKFSSAPCFLQKVYKDEVWNGNGFIEGDYKKLLMIAVHAVFLESGFVCFDSVSKKKIEGFRFPEEGKLSNVARVRYTVPDLLNAGDEVFEIVDLKFHTMGKFVNVHGSLSRNSVDMFRACLDKSRFAPSVEFVCVLNFDSVGEKEMDESLKSLHEKKVFDLWKIVKDELALPLLINLCEKNGLGSPPCFSVLPTDLKLKILEFVSGTDLAKVGCVSSELRYLSSSNDLWKQKYVEEFSLVDSGDSTNSNWKEKFVICREKNKKGNVRPYFLPFTRPRLPYFVPGRREPRPFSFPGIIGGDYDLFPAPFGSNSGLRGLRLPARRNFVRYCNLDGSDA